MKGCHQGEPRGPATPSERMPTWNTFPAGCACAASDHVIAVPPRSAIKPLRRMCPRKDHVSYIPSSIALFERAANGNGAQSAQMLLRPDVRDGSMPSKKSFGGNKRNFLKLLMRFVRSDVRDHIASQKNDHGPSYQH